MEARNEPPEAMATIMKRLQSNGKVNKHLCYDDIVSKKGEHSLQRVYRKHGIRYRSNPRYDERGSIAILNHMFTQKSIILHPKCDILSLQLSTWKMKTDKPEKIGVGMALALCNIVSDLKNSGQLATLPIFEPYSKTKQFMRERLKRGKGVTSKTRRSKHEWLI